MLRTDMKIIKFITDRIKSYKHKRTINRLRGHLAFFGHNASNMTDEEVERLIIKAGQRLSYAAKISGVTTEEARSSFISASRLMRSTERDRST